MSEEKKNPLTLNVEFSITEQKSSFDNPTLISAKFSEKVPANCDSILYLKKRLKEELDRQKMVLDSYKSISRLEESGPLDF